MENIKHSFHVGDKVYLRPWNKVKNHHGALRFNWYSLMNKPLTIRYIHGNALYFKETELWFNDSCVSYYALPIFDTPFPWSNFMSGKIYVYCSTIESRKSFLKKCENHSICWVNDDKATEFTPLRCPYILITSHNSQMGCLPCITNTNNHPIYDWDTRSFITSKQWTKNELTKAKELSHRLLCDLFDKECGVNFNIVKEEKTVYCIVFGNNCKSETDISSTANKDDIFNETIGKCVCLCKATETPIPDFILNK